MHIHSYLSLSKETVSVLFCIEKLQKKEVHREELTCWEGALCGNEVDSRLSFAITSHYFMPWEYAVFFRV